MIRKVI